MITFYDSAGRPVAYTDDGEYIYLFNGRPVAYIFRNLVYNYGGTLLGRFENGWIRDKLGCCVFFSEFATGYGPMKPMRQMRPMKSMKQMRPMKGMRQMPQMKAMNSSSWSNLSGDSFFIQ